MEARRLIKKAANQIADTVKRSDPSLNLSVKEPLFVAILKQVPGDLNDTTLKDLIPKCSKIGQCGKSRAFKVYFQTRADQDQFLRDSLKIGYERLPVQEFFFMPRRCFNCHVIGHVAANCLNSAICSKCGASDHKSSSDSPCKKSPFCVDCKVPGHTCYNVSCPKNRKAVNP